MSKHTDILNQRLADNLGYVGDLPRFAWLYAPNQLRLVYDTDDRTLLRKTWADAPAPDGGVIGRAWVLAERRVGKATDHCGYGEGIRVAATGRLEYAPYFETAITCEPSSELNANYIWALRHQLDMSAESREDAFENWMAEEQYTSTVNAERDREANRERAMHVYDDNVGAFGNCEVGVGDGFLSWGGVGDSPLVRKLQEPVAA